MKTELIQDIFTMMLSIAGHEDHDDYDDHGKLFLLIQKLTSSDKRKKLSSDNCGASLCNLDQNMCLLCFWSLHLVQSWLWLLPLCLGGNEETIFCRRPPLLCCDSNPVQLCSAVALTLYNPALLYPAYSAPLFCSTVSCTSLLFCSHQEPNTAVSTTGKYPSYREGSPYCQ